MHGAARAAFLPAETDGPAATEALGRRLAPHLPPGTVVALHGALGAGKTHLAKGICAALGVPPEEVVSPTFTLVHEYEGAGFPIYHMDAYRLERVEAFYDLGYEEYLYGDGLCLIEWPERVAPLLPPGTVHLYLAHAGADRRRIALTPEEAAPA